MEAATIVRDARDRSGLTLRQLAVRAATSHTAIAAYEAGTKIPTVATLGRLIAACGMRAEVGIHPRDPFEDRRRRGEELRQVLDLADQFPAHHAGTIPARFPPRPT